MALALCLAFLAVTVAYAAHQSHREVRWLRDAWSRVSGGGGDRRA